MVTNRHIVREVAQRMSAAANRTVQALSKGRVEHEPAMTDRMLGAIEESIHLADIGGVVWQAKTLTDRGGKSQESVHGADFMGVLDIQLPEFKVQKGFLAQAKLLRRRGKDDWTTLRAQCEKMLQRSTESYVFLYSDKGIRVVPALSVIAAQGPTRVSDLYGRTAKKFFEEHLQCFIGDRAISSASPLTLERLEALRVVFEASRLIVIQASVPSVAAPSEESR